MDSYGILNALRAFASQLADLSRHSGRTSKMIDSVREGDVIVVATQGCINHIDNMLRARKQLSKKEVIFVVIDPTNPGNSLARSGHLISKARNAGSIKVHFDHTWIEKRVQHALVDEAEHMDHLAHHITGFHPKEADKAHSAKNETFAAKYTLPE